MADHEGCFSGVKSLAAQMRSPSFYRVEALRATTKEPVSVEGVLVGDDDGEWCIFAYRKAESLLSMLSKANSGVATALTISPVMSLIWDGVGLLAPSLLVSPYRSPSAKEY